MASLSLLVAVQPPTVTTVSTVLCPPLAVIVSVEQQHLGDNIDLSKVFAFATLLDENGNAVEDALSGRLAESAHAHPSEEVLAYFLFENLTIKGVGRFSIHITLMRVDSSGSESGPSTEGVASIMQVDSRSIMVREGYIQAESPSELRQLLIYLACADVVEAGSEQRFLDALPEI